jgi:hypothetical protein
MRTFPTGGLFGCIIPWWIDNDSNWPRTKPVFVVGSCSSSVREPFFFDSLKVWKTGRLEAVEGTIKDS